MKKQYKKPVATIYSVINSDIIATSEVTYKGSNKGTGVNMAESKTLLMDDDSFGEEW